MLSAKVLNKHDSAKVEMKGTKKAAKNEKYSSNMVQQDSKSRNLWFNCNDWRDINGNGPDSEKAAEKGKRSVGFQMYISWIPTSQLNKWNTLTILQRHFLKKIFYFYCFGIFVCMLQSEQVCTDIFDLHLEDRAQSLGCFITLHIMCWGKIFHLKLEQPTQLV